MSKFRWTRVTFSAALLSLLLLVALVAAACAEEEEAAPAPTATSPIPTPASSPTSIAEAAPTPTPRSVSEEVREIQIDTLQSLAFNPSQIVVEPGETVKFVITNQSSLLHTFTIAISSAKEEILVDVSMPPGESKTVTITFPEEPAQLYLFCRPHESFGMTGTVQVGEEGSLTPTPTPGAGGTRTY